MKTKQHGPWAITLGTAVALCGTLAAQVPQPASPSQPTQGQSGEAGRAISDSVGMVTATGCLQRDSSAAARTEAGAGGASAGGASIGAAGAFLLKNARMSSNRGDTSRGAVDRGRGDRDLRLTADAGVDLAQHVGHQVTVSGRVTGAGGASSPTSNSGSSGAAGASGYGAAAEGNPRGGVGRNATLVVNTVSMISSSCGGS